jgi:hypothetical protein
MREVALLSLLVIREAAFEVAMLALVGLRGCLGGRELFSNSLASALELGEARTERAELCVEGVDHVIVGLQRQQRFEILMHSHPPVEMTPPARGNGVTKSHRGLPR